MAVRWWVSAVSSWLRRSWFWVARSVSPPLGFAASSGGARGGEGGRLKEAREALMREGGNRGEDRARSKGVG